MLRGTVLLVVAASLLSGCTLPEGAEGGLASSPNPCQHATGAARLVCKGTPSLGDVVHEVGGNSTEATFEGTAARASWARDLRDETGADNFTWESAGDVMLVWAGSGLGTMGVRVLDDEGRVIYIGDTGASGGRHEVAGKPGLWTFEIGYVAFTGHASVQLRSLD